MMIYNDSEILLYHLYCHTERHYTAMRTKFYWCSSSIDYCCLISIFCRYSSENCRRSSNRWHSSKDCRYSSKYCHDIKFSNVRHDSIYCCGVSFCCCDGSFYHCHVSISAGAAVFTTVALENTDKTAVTNTAATSVKFSSQRSKMSFSVRRRLRCLVL